jgi:transcriptional regulator with XRE-family HTH domain
MPQANGPQIEHHRVKLGIHRSALAAKVGLSYPHLYNIEKNLKVASIEALNRIANELGVPVEELVQPDDERRSA